MLNNMANIEINTTNKDIKSNIDEVYISSERRSGNSTRQVNRAIDLLYDGCIVMVMDHHGNGTVRQSNEYLFYKILKRLDCEHDLKSLIKNKSIIIDKQDLTIQFV
jgi:hypothetical protein